MRQRIGRKHRQVAQFVLRKAEPLNDFHEPDLHVLVIALGVIPHHPAAHDDGDGKKQRIEVQYWSQGGGQQDDRRFYFEEDFRRHPKEHYGAGGAPEQGRCGFITHDVGIILTRSGSAISKAAPMIQFVMSCNRFEPVQIAMTIQIPAPSAIG